MTMTLQEMRDFVRLHADADVADAPDQTLDVYARIAYNDILARRNSWPHLSVSYTLTTVASTKVYPYTGLSTTGLSQVSAVVDSTNLGRRLIYMSQSDADLAYGAPVGMTSQVATSFSVENESIILYPTPSTSGKVYTVRGFRNEATWPNGAGTTPDLPGVLHEAIAWYMLSGYFMGQEDTQLAGTYLNEYEGMVDRHVRNESSKEYSARPLIMGGQNTDSLPTFGRWVRGMLE